MKVLVKHIRGMYFQGEGERASGHPRVFKDIEVAYKFWGESLAEDKLQRAACTTLNGEIL